jgi:NAD(P)H-dependent FMN reductase
MPHIAILSASVRNGRKSHRVALFFQNFINHKQLATSEIVDLNEYKFPVFEERLPYLNSPSPQILDFARRIQSADGILIVTPEYNGGYPAALKNVIDLLTTDWRRKPVAICTVSDGSFGGSQVIMSLQFSLWKIKAWTVPAMFPVPKVDESFDEQGVPFEREITEKRAESFVNELLWCVKARQMMI